MPWIRIPGGGVAHVKMTGHAQRGLKFCRCSYIATKLCDWRIDDAGRTCDEPICDAHAWSPAPDKDLCPRHLEQYRELLRNLHIPQG